MAERTFRLPDLGEGLDEAVVDAWLVAEGDVVELNQPIAEIETAKATVEVPSPFAGRVAALHTTAGSTLKVGDPLVTIDVDGEAAGCRRRTAAAPAVRAFARERGVDLDRLTGSGPDGRVTREDVEHAASGSIVGGARVDRSQVEGEEVEERPLTPLRRTAAQRLTAAASIPTVTTWRSIDCSALERVRTAVGTSPLPLVVRALADVCRRHPEINASWTDRAIVVRRHVNVGIATETDRGLLVPVVRDADRLTVAEIAERIAGLASRARDGSITPDELAGHTITVTNTGSYGSEAGTPLLNVPDAVIVALGAIEQRPLVVDGAVQARPACTLSVTFDHRVLDGATVGRALNDLVAILQDEDALEALRT